MTTNLNLPTIAPLLQNQDITEQWAELDRI